MKLLFYPLCFLIEICHEFVRCIINAIIDTFNIILLLFLRYLKFIQDIIIENAKKHIDTSFVRIALRLATIVSISVFFVLNKYEFILGGSSSDVFDFMAGVIIIPVIITQVFEINSEVRSKAD